jgi:Queuosine biosynthesis protein QueC
VRPAAFQILPYSIGWVELEDLSLASLYPPIPPEEDKVLAICSSGMDSTTAAAYHLRRGQQVTLLHFDIGQRAAEREQEAVHEIAEALGVPVKVTTTDLWKQFHSRSTLIDRTRPVRTGHYGQDGAELHHDWVDFRNTLLLAMAGGQADAQGFHTICLAGWGWRRPVSPRSGGGEAAGRPGGGPRACGRTVCRGSLGGHRRRGPSCGQTDGDQMAGALAIRWCRSIAEPKGWSTAGGSR